MRAARASGVPIREITVDPATGKIAVVVGDIAEGTEDSAREEAVGTKAWDEATVKLRGKTAAQPKPQ
jgi:hypothetical protein